MFRKIAFVVLAVAVVAVIGLAVAGRFLVSNTAFQEESHLLYIHTGQADQDHVMKLLEEHRIIKNPGSFQWLATRMKVWQSLRPGRYEIKKGMNLLELARMLRSGVQSPINLVINKIRTKENLAALIDRKFETDSAAVIAFLNDNEALAAYQLDTNTVMTAVFPNTYTYLWTSSPETIFRKLYQEHQKIWNTERIAKADSLGLTPVTTYILASIIEEETTYHDEKKLMASVYLNRLARGMPLGADPTVKFALRDFGLKRILTKHLTVESPYNTYRNKGLPPGPICTPSLRTIDEVLKAPSTDYLFFVAKKDFSQGHVFTSRYSDHLRYAREYQRALSQQQKLRKASEDLTE